MNKDEHWLLEEKYGGVESKAFHADLVRLKASEPLAYIIGSIPFLDCTIYLDTKPLIPRVETEFWVEKAIEAIRRQPALHLASESLELGGFGRGNSSSSESSAELDRFPSLKILDLCAGSGAIGVAVAKAISEATVHFAEIDRAHLPTIGKNLEENGIDCSRYKVFASDLFENATETYDYILTNPPYIDPALDRTETSVKNHEPHLALYAEDNGLALIEKIIEEAKEYLNQNGKLYMEHEPEQADKIQLLAKQNDFLAETHTDQYKVPRYSILTMAQ